jgi:hypothetical protein
MHTEDLKMSVAAVVSLANQLSINSVGLGLVPRGYKLSTLSVVVSSHVSFVNALQINSQLVCNSI